MEEEEVQQELRDQLCSLTFSPPPMNKSDTRDSISSIDSDVSLSFDRRGSKGEEADASDDASSDGESKLEKSKLDNLDDSKDPPQVEEPPNVTVLQDNFVPPDDELADKICAQVEFYFSDENIVKDAFLLKHVKRNKEGYVSLKLISSFKRVKHLSRDWRVVGAALARSSKLEVNELGTKLRRLQPLPQFDQTTPSRTVLVAKLPLQKITVESVAELFKSCGEIALIRVLRPGHPAPAEVRQAIAKRPELATSEECALIEFTDSASARAAMKLSLGEAKIFELQSIGEKKKKQQPTKKQNKKDDNCHTSSCSEPEDGRIKHKRLMHLAPPPPPIYPPMHIYQPHPYQGAPSPESWMPRRLSACSISSAENGYILRRLSSCSNSGLENANFNRRFSSCSSSSENGFCAPIYPVGFCPPNRRFSYCSNSGSNSGCGAECSGTCYNHRRSSVDCAPFIRKLSTCSRDSGFDSRRLSSCSSSSESGFFRPRSNSNNVIPHLPENITRLPSGPDGTRGFGRPPRFNNSRSQVETSY